MQSTDPEIWKPVVGHEGRYEVSDLGRVRSLDRHARAGRHESRFYPGKMLKPVSNGPDSRCTVSIHDGHGRQRTRLVHHLVLEAFVGPRPDSMEACHWDGDASNNRLDNLRWDTHLENEADKNRHGTHPNRAKTHCPRGHALVEPNIPPGELSRGHRKCRACSIAASAAFKRGEPLEQALADKKFADIMSGRINVRKAECPIGHVLEVPNLVPSLLKQGHRGCLACNRARGTSKCRRYGFDPEIADEKYREIMMSEGLT